MIDESLLNSLSKKILNLESDLRKQCFIPFKFNVDNEFSLIWDKCLTSNKYRLFYIDSSFDKPLIETNLETRLRCSKFLTSFRDNCLSSQDKYIKEHIND